MPDSSAASLPLAPIESSPTEEDHDRRTDEVIAAVQKTGEASFGGTTWLGRRAMRVIVWNWQTSDEDVEQVVKAVASEKLRVRLRPRTVCGGRAAFRIASGTNRPGWSS